MGIERGKSGGGWGKNDGRGLQIDGGRGLLSNSKRNRVAGCGLRVAGCQRVATDRDPVWGLACKL